MSKKSVSMHNEGEEMTDKELLELAAKAVGITKNSRFLKSYPSNLPE
jgi:hypothetical protein